MIDIDKALLVFEKKDPDVMIIAHQYRIKHLQIRILPLQIATMKRRIESKGNMLKTYITNNKEKLGIPDDLDINFDF